MVVSHGCKATFTEPTDQSEMVFIEAKYEEIVFLEPRIPASYFGVKLNCYLMEDRTLEAWEALFRGLRSQKLDEGEARAFFEIGKAEEAKEIGKSPVKKRRLHDEAAEQVADVLATLVVKPAEDLGKNDTEMLLVLRSEWKTLVMYAEALHEMLKQQQTANTNLRENVLKEFKGVDYHIAKLLNLIGQRGMELTTIMEAIHSLQEEAGSMMDEGIRDWVHSLEQALMSLANVEDQVGEIKADIAQETLTSIQPLIKPI